jgi:hypothetical protein
MKSRFRQRDSLGITLLPRKSILQPAKGRSSKFQTKPKQLSVLSAKLNRTRRRKCSVTH